MDELERLSRAGRHGVRVAVAESLTSGLLCADVGAAADASEWFAGGVVAYLTGTKEHLLGLVPGTDPCSDACAIQLAQGVRELLVADIAVSTTGIGGPEPEGGHAPGTVHLGWATAADAGSRRFDFDGDPGAVLRLTVEAARSLLVELAEAAASPASDVASGSLRTR